MSALDRLNAVRSLLADPPETPDPWDDVRLVAAMDIRNQDVLNQLLLRDRDRLRGSWDQVQQALGGEPAPAQGGISLDRPGQGAAPAAPASPEVPEPQLQPSGPPDPATVTRRREALQEWLGRSRAFLEDRDIETLAESGALTVEDLHQVVPKLVNKRLVRARAAEISEALRSVQDAAPAAAAAPVTPPAPAPSTTKTPTPPPAAPARPMSTSHGFGSTATTPSAPPAGPLADATFVSFDFTRQADPAGAVKARAVVDGSGIALNWPAAQEESAGWYAYRVVGSDESALLYTEGGFTVCATQACTAEDPEPMTGAVRHYTVWVYSGPDEKTARDSQPRLHATGQVIRQVSTLQLRTERGRVYAQWVAPARDVSVTVLRIPTARAARVTSYDVTYTFPETLIVKDGGFEDTPPPGEYEYRVFTQVYSAEGAEYSSPVTATVDVVVEVEQITDLTAERQEDGTVTLSWTPPASGHVEIYRLPRLEEGALIGRTESKDALVTTFKTGPLVQPHTTDPDGRSVLDKVDVPDGWVTVQFVPVTCASEQRQRVGKPAALFMPQPPTDVRLLERVSQQVLTFAWPGDRRDTADQPDQMVVVYQLPPDAPTTEHPTSEPIAEVTLDKYDAQGGVFLSRPLPPGGCKLQLHGAMFSAGQRRVSAPTVVEYRGLTRIDYRAVRPEPAVVPQPQRRGLFKREAAAPTPQPTGPKQVRIRADRDLRDITIILVHNPNRVPLHSGDGVSVFNFPVPPLPAGQWGPLPWVPEPHLTGFVRMFVAGQSADSRPIAVLEGSVSDLRVI